MVLELTAEDRDLVGRIKACKKESEDHLKPWHTHGNERYRLYRGVKAYREAARKASPPDKDDIMRQAGRDWSADLHIPLAYSTVETILPRAVSNRPRGLVLPTEMAAEGSVENMRLLCDSQQEKARYELVAQETAKSGFIFGLGAQKLTWRTQTQQGGRYLDRATDKEAVGSDWVVRRKDRTIYDDPWPEDVDIFDLFWNPTGYDSFTLDWILHRTWRTTAYVMALIKSGKWNSPYAKALTEEDVKAMEGAGGENDALWKERMTAAGHTNFDSRRGRIHEVWEYWDGGETVITLLNGRLPVQIAENPYWHGEMPFHFYRPTTPGIKQLHGIGEIEPLVDLIRELDTLRSQRRDNAALVLQRIFAFDPDSVNKDHLKLGPGWAIPVQNNGGSIRDFLHPIDVGDIPHSSYAEEDRIKDDADRTSGVSDITAGSGGAAQTATGVNTLMAAANVRIENKSHRLEVETIAPVMNQWIALNQQKIVSREVRVDRLPEPGEIYPKMWRFLKLTPAELAGGMAYSIQGGSIAPENASQKAAQGMAVFNALRGNPAIAEPVMLRYFLESQGVKQPDAWLSPEASVPAQIVDQIKGALTQRFGGDVQAIFDYIMNGDHGGQPGN